MPRGMVRMEEWFSLNCHVRPSYEPGESVFVCLSLSKTIHFSLSLSINTNINKQTYLSHFTFSLYLYICLPLSRFLSPRISLILSLLSRCCIHLHALNTILAPFSISCNSSLIHLQYWAHVNEEGKQIICSYNA